MYEPRLALIAPRPRTKRAGLTLVGGRSKWARQRTYQPVDDIDLRNDDLRETAEAERLTGVRARSSWQRRYAAGLRISDFIVVGAAVILAQKVRFGHTLTAPGYPDYYLLALSALFAIAWLSALARFRTRSPRLIGTGAEEYRRVIAASFWTFGAIAIITLLLKLDIARGYLAVALPAGTVGLVLSRWIWHGYIARKRARGQCQTAVLAFGERDAVAHLIDELTRNRADGYQVVGIGIPGYRMPAGEHLTVNGRAIPIVGGEARCVRRNSCLRRRHCGDRRHGAFRGPRNSKTDLGSRADGRRSRGVDRSHGLCALTVGDATNCRPPAAAH